MLVRKPAVAGTFYPQEKGKLSLAIESFLEKARLFYSWDKKIPKVIISPHAGINFSGPVAAWGYKHLLDAKGIKNVVLIGTSHNYLFSHGAVFGQGVWQTPLGKIGINEKLTKKLIQTKGFEDDPSPHLPEHTLEMQLIFLQKVIANDFKIIPILFSQINQSFLATAAGGLAKILSRKDTAMVVSTDLSHYPDYKIANVIDSMTVESVLSADKEKFRNWINDLNKWRGFDVETLACGQEAIKLVLEIAERLKLEDRRYYRYANSGDVAEEKDRVVGYGSLGFYEGKQDYQVEGLQLARRTLEFFMRTGKLPKIDIKSARLNKIGGVFVTLRKQGELRGCIGNIVGKETCGQGIAENILNAAFHDPRFEPLNYSEVKDVNIEVSLLSPLKKVNDWRKIKLGCDGVMIKKGGAGGVFLPQVGREITDLEHFLSLLCVEKAGLEADCYKNLDTELYTFTAQVFEE